MGTYHKEDHRRNTANCVCIHGAIIVGAGPSGIAAAACLRHHGVHSLILEKTASIAFSWRHKTPDRLQLQHPREFCRLPLLNFPENHPTFPTKSQFITYLDAYATRFSIEPEFHQAVSKAEFDPATGLWRVQTQGFLYFTRWLIVATGEHDEPFSPALNGIERFKGKVIHSSEYKSGSEFKRERVLVVGGGNSAMEVSLDLCDHDASPHMVVRSSVHVLPRDTLGISTFALAILLLRCLPLRLVDKIILFLAYLTLGDTQRLGFWRPKLGPFELRAATGKTPVLDVGAVSEIKSGKIKVMEGVREITENGAKFVGGHEKEFDSIVLATGYKSNVHSWLKGSDFFKEDGMPKSQFPNSWKGENGLYAVGFTGRGLSGISSDAAKVARDIADQWRIIESWESCCGSQILPTKLGKIENDQNNSQ